MEELRLVPLSEYQADCRILDIAPGASVEEIRQAYLDQSKVWHPDRFLHDVRLHKKAEEKIKQISLAYRRLCGLSPYDQPELSIATPVSSSDWGIAVFALGRALRNSAILITTPFRWLVRAAVTISNCVFQWCSRERRSLAIATSAFALGFAFAVYLLPRDSESWANISGRFERTMGNNETAQAIVAQAPPAAPTASPEIRSVAMSSPEIAASLPPWSFGTSSELTMTAGSADVFSLEKNTLTTPSEVRELEATDGISPTYESVRANDWLKRFSGGEDNPSTARGDYILRSFVPRQNTFFFALAYNDIEQAQIKPEEPNVTSWSKPIHLEPRHIITRQQSEEAIKTKHHHPTAVEPPHASNQSDESVVSPSGVTPEKRLGERKRSVSGVTIKPLRVHRAPNGSVMAPSATKAVTTYAPRPDYPEGARSRRIGGSGVCMVSVDPISGAVTNASMAESTGSLILDRSALRTLRTWRFKPGAVSEVSIPVEFTTEEEDR